MKKNMLAIFGFVFMLSIIMAGCGNSEGAESSAGDKTNGKDDAATVSGAITAVGSSALQPLVEAASQQFSTENAGAVINVQGGGSGTGLSKISEGAVDIGNSDIFAEEKDGIDTAKLVDHKVAVVGMGPVVHPDVNVQDITQEQLIDIFTGKIKNWKEIGGADQDIIVINRAQGSGTRATFEQFGLNGAEPAQAQEQDSSGTVRKIVSETPGAISYLAFSYFDDSLVALKVDGNEPTQANVETNDWKIWAYQHMYTNGEPSGLTKEFLDYMLSPEVQDNLVPELDYLPVTGMQVERDAEGNVK
ncbi:phosphate ABC transporter substrate-binding protein PstS family protein [Lederbergia lenta]|uniref:Phosphate-binding protein n=1 Tax=Lederbergia lenta TaxID=1467 RepID=A0A2X4WGC0_LEDLE|nr:phosphate ABC transporter substrate-binding protein PstS family protein [Lederbergia lenta]MEC2322810.1 phosphate ABC transporter substrate-binding protein PstS family protein [Lederbergia lenta]SQI61879.1 phosphate binding protein [Lederbergia lenta]